MGCLETDKTAELTPQGLDAFIFHMEEEYERLVGLVTENRCAKGDAERTLSRWVKWLNLALGDTDNHLHHNHIRDEDLKGCTSQRSALERIARLSDGIVRVGEASEIIVRCGLSLGTKASVQATAHRTMSHDVDSWEWTAPGTFRFLKNDVLEGRPVTVEFSAIPAPEPAPVLDNMSHALLQKHVRPVTPGQIAD